MRTIPRPNPNYNPNVTINEKLPTSKIHKVDINKEIDDMINMYFDQNNIPTNQALITYSKYFVNNGNISIQNKMKLKDICYYIIQFVIPSIPSEDNPSPTMTWPYIEFLSGSLRPFSISSGPKEYSPFLMYEITPTDYKNEVNGNLNAPGLAPGSSLGSGGSSGSSSSSSTTSGKNDGSSKNSDGSCGCPTSCFANILDAVMNPPSANGVSPGSSSSSSSSWGYSSSPSPGSKSPGGFGANGALGSDISGSPFAKSGMSSLMENGSHLRITYEKQTKTNGELEGNVDGFINNYFGRGIFNIFMAT
jgi:hypothetical protein